MDLTVNGQAGVSVPAHVQTVGDLVRHWLPADAQEGVAVARNDVIVPRSQWETTPIQDRDTFEIAAPFAGG
jgi:thiamine biosynthesis protein ThiS